MLIGAGFAVYAAGDLVYLFYLDMQDSVPVPSPADLLYQSLFPLAYCGIALLLRRRVMGLGLAPWLDGLIGGMGSAAVAAAFAFQPIMDHSGGDRAEVMTLLAFISGDLFMVAFVVAAISMLGWRIPMSWVLLGVGFIAFACSDAFYLIQVTADTYSSGTPLDAGWMVAALMVAFAAGPASRPHQSHRASGTSLALPLIFAAFSLAVLAYAGHNSQTEGLAVNVATITLLLSLGRLALAHDELRNSAQDRALARTDELTGLPNRRAFAELLHQDVSRPSGGRGKAAKSPGTLAVLLIDLDNFKEVNDTLCHAAGDQLLKQAGQRMMARLRSVDTLARWGGDEFAVVLPSADATVAGATAQAVAQALQAPFVLEDLTLHLGGSVGIALYPDHASTATDLIRQADIAMYEAKATREQWCLYEATTDQHTQERLQLLDQLRGALRQAGRKHSADQDSADHDSPDQQNAARENEHGTNLSSQADQIVLHYQPKATLDSRAVVGVEALARWQHPTKGLLFPDAFLPLVETSGLMREFTLCVLHQAVSQCARWFEQGITLPVAVNLSAISVLDEDLPQVLADLLEQYHLPAIMLEVEITEDFLLKDRVRAHSVLARIRDSGITVSVDDYGTGYSSLAYLRDLPVDQLKLDRSFVSPMSDDPGAAAIVESTVALAHSLGLTMVAEGVEDMGAWEALEQYGCDHAQGFWLCKPIPTEQLVDWLHEREAEGAQVGLDASRVALIPTSALPRPRRGVTGPRGSAGEVTLL